MNSLFLAETASNYGTFQSELKNSILFFVAAIVILLIIKFVFQLVESRPKRELKERQSLKGMRELAIKKQLEADLVDKTKASTRHKVEMLCTQAGLNLNYGEFRMITILCAIVLPILVMITLKNIFLALAMIPLGYMLPGQIIALIRNRRIGLLERQIESFMELFCERYKLTQLPSQALEDSVQDFVGQQPVYSELLKSVGELNTGEPILEVMERLAHRSANKYLIRMVTNLKMAEDIGTTDARELLLNKALDQYRKNKTMKAKLQEKITGPKRESMILLIAVPCVMVYQAAVSDAYVDFMINTTTGKVGIAAIAVITLLCMWFINKKIGAPIE